VMELMEHTHLLSIRVARTFFQRAIGLLGRSRLGKYDGMYFPDTNSVHTLGMLFAIDVVYLDSRNEIVKIQSNLKPFRVSWCWGAASSVELAAGAAAAHGLDVGRIWLIENFLEKKR
jgi:uncharacterized protein